MKKAEIAGQIFVYVIAIVVVGFIIVYGYSSIATFTKRGEEVEYISLKTDLENSFKAIVSDYGSIKRPDFDIPGKYDKVCFVKKEMASAASVTELCQSAFPDIYQPIVCSSWQTGRDNVFLVPDGSESFDVGDIVIRDAVNDIDDIQFLCFDVVNNRIRLQLTGLGDKVEVSEYS